MNSWVMKLNLFVFCGAMQHVAKYAYQTRRWRLAWRFARRFAWRFARRFADSPEDASPASTSVWSLDTEELPAHRHRISREYRECRSTALLNSSGPVVRCHSLANLLSLRVSRVRFPESAESMEASSAQSESLHLLITSRQLSTADVRAFLRWITGTQSAPSTALRTWNSTSHIFPSMISMQEPLKHTFFAVPNTSLPSPEASSGRRATAENGTQQGDPKHLVLQPPKRTSWFSTTRNWIYNEFTQM